MPTDDIARLKKRIRGNIGPQLVAVTGASIGKLQGWALHNEPLDQIYIDRLRYHFTNNLRFANRPETFY